MKTEVFIVAKWERKLDMKWILFFGGLLEELSLTFSKEKQIQQLKKVQPCMRGRRGLHWKSMACGEGTVKRRGESLANVRPFIGETLKAEVCLFSRAPFFKVPAASRSLPNKWTA